MIRQTGRRRSKQSQSVPSVRKGEATHRNSGPGSQRGVEASQGYMENKEPREAAHLVFTFGLEEGRKGDAGGPAAAAPPLRSGKAGPDASGAS